MGRPRGFDEDEVLDRALAVFLQRGYEAASISDLVTATGINRYSLYDTFGDKHGLFLASLDRYHDKRRAQVAALLRQPGPKLPQIRKYFEAIAEEAFRNEPSGCLMVNSTMELARKDPATAERASKHFANIEELFVEALCQAQEDREFPPRSDLRAVARFLLNNARGLRVVVQYTRDRNVVGDIVETAFSIF